MATAPVRCGDGATQPPDPGAVAMLLPCRVPCAFCVCNTFALEYSDSQSNRDRNNAGDETRVHDLCLIPENKSNKAVHASAILPKGVGERINIWICTPRSTYPDYKLSGVPTGAPQREATV